MAQKKDLSTLSREGVKDYVDSRVREMQQEKVAGKRRGSLDDFFQSISQELAKGGYTSPTGSGPISPKTVRYIHYYGLRRWGSAAKTKEATVELVHLEKKLEMVKNILSLKADAENKLSLIEQILDA